VRWRSGADPLLADVQGALYSDLSFFEENGAKRQGGSSPEPEHCRHVWRAASSTLMYAVKWGAHWSSRLARVTRIPCNTARKTWVI
jgi:hypothetical protein